MAFIYQRWDDTEGKRWLDIPLEEYKRVGALYRRVISVVHQDESESGEALEQVLDLVKQDGEAWHAHAKDDPAPGAFDEWKSVRRHLVSILRDHFELLEAYRVGWRAAEDALTQAVPGWYDGTGSIAENVKAAIEALARRPEDFKEVQPDGTVTSVDPVDAKLDACNFCLAEAAKAREALANANKRISESPDDPHPEHPNIPRTVIAGNMKYGYRMGTPQAIAFNQGARWWASVVKGDPRP